MSLMQLQNDCRAWTITISLLPLRCQSVMYDTKMLMKASKYSQSRYLQDKLDITPTPL